MICASQGGTISAPAGTDSDTGTKLLNKHFPSSAANPTNLVYKLSQPVWDDPDSVNAASSQLTASGLFTGVTGPLNPAGVTLTPAQFTSLHATLGDPRALPAVPPSGLVPTIGEKVKRYLDVIDGLAFMEGPREGRR